MKKRTTIYASNHPGALLVPATEEVAKSWTCVYDREGKLTKKEIDELIATDCFVHYRVYYGEILGSLIFEK